VVRGLNRRVPQRTGERSKALKTDAAPWSTWVKLGAGTSDNGKRATAGDEPVRLLARGRP
jgi:hypothetical protein